MKRIRVSEAGKSFVADGGSSVLKMSKTIVSVIILLVMIVSLGSLSYQVGVTRLSTDTTVSGSTYFYTNVLVYLETGVTQIMVPYSTATFWYFTAYPLCDPASNACPGPAVASMSTISEWSAIAYQTTVTSQATQTLFTRFSALSTRTITQQAPAYSAIGVSEQQFGAIATLIVLAGIIGIYLVNARRPMRR